MIDKKVRVLVFQTCLVASFGFSCIALLSGCSSSKKKSEIVNEPNDPIGLELTQASSHGEIADEPMAGKMMAAHFAGLYGLDLKNQDQLRYVNLVGQTLVEQAGRPDILFRFGILKTDVPEILSTPNGYIFISRGLLLLLESEHELAGFLANEIAHINEHHHKELFARSQTIKGQDSETANIKESNRTEFGIQKLLSEGYSRDLTFEADAAASIYLATTGYSPLKFAQGLKRLSRIDRVSKRPTFSLISQRVSNLDGFLKRNGLAQPGFGSETVMVKRFEKFLTSVKSTRK